MHETVLKEEAVAALLVDNGGCYVDGTFGRGGHSRKILGSLNEAGTLIALDRDAAAEAEAETIVDARFRFYRSAFSDLVEVLASEQKLGACDGILLDIGVSSPQLDEAERGFSFRADGPLDMRMDQSKGLSAAEWLAGAEETEIAQVLKVYGEERFAKRIARRIVEFRAEQALETTAQLASICEQSVGKREPGKHPATRSFQAIRIKINGELEELSAALEASLSALKVGGRLVVISFHSLEDRITKHFMRKQSRPAPLPKSVPIAGDAQPMPLKLVGKAVFASAEEVDRNPRARSAVMRIAERIN